jgi:hypothetical protein
VPVQVAAFADELVSGYLFAADAAWADCFGQISGKLLGLVERSHGLNVLLIVRWIVFWWHSHSPFRVRGTQAQ